MRRTFAVLLMLLSLCVATCSADSSGYFFVAPGGVTGGGGATLHLGAGGELGVIRGFGVAAELGGLGPTSKFSSLLGVFSLNGAYHFMHSSDGRLDPFATAGYSLFFRSGHENLANFGGGANYWFLKKLGLRLEFRDHVLSSPGPTLHYWNFRFGVAVR